MLKLWPVLLVFNTLNSYFFIACIGGGGQLKTIDPIKQIDSLYRNSIKDNQSKIVSPENNPWIIYLYK